MPRAVEAAGFSVTALRLQALLIGGVFAGLAGGYLSLVINGSFTENCTVGRGFVAIAMVTFGRWRPVWVLGAAVLIGFMESLQYSLQSATIPFQFWVAMPYVAALIVLAISKQNSASPKALGVPYRREK
jgi:simple sugar transport system permease protein